MTLPREQVAERMDQADCRCGGVDFDRAVTLCLVLIAEAEDAKAAEMRERAAVACEEMGGWRDWAALKDPSFPGAPCEAGAAADFLATRIRSLPLRPDAGTPGDATEPK